jgi:vacuolar-type H+-ATPase subunit E/Vma4
MRRILSALKLKAEVVASLEALGGLRASTPDGRIRVDNTVEARLEKARPELRRKLAALLSAEEGSWQATTVTAMPASGR